MWLMRVTSWKVNMVCRNSSVGRARDWKSLCPWFNSELRHHFLKAPGKVFFYCHKVKKWALTRMLCKAQPSRKTILNRFSRQSELRHHFLKAPSKVFFYCHKVKKMSLNSDVVSSTTLSKNDTQSFFSAEWVAAPFKMYIIWCLNSLVWKKIASWSKNHNLNILILRVD